MTDEIPQPDLRTVLMWLAEHELPPTVECWVLSESAIHPIESVTSDDTGDVTLTTGPLTLEATPMHYGSIFDTLIETYSGGGHLRWRGAPRHTYRGSYTRNPSEAVFFVFLPESIQPPPETYAEEMDKRKQQARELTQEIERSQKPNG